MVAPCRPFGRHRAFRGVASFQDIKLGGLSLLLYAAISVLLWWAYARVL
jgi:hypothetical protein